MNGQFTTPSTPSTGAGSHVPAGAGSPVLAAGSRLIASKQLTADDCRLSWPPRRRIGGLDISRDSSTPPSSPLRRRRLERKS